MQTGRLIGRHGGQRPDHDETFLFPWHLLARLSRERRRDVLQ